MPVLRMAHRKWKETKQLPSMLPGPAVPGSWLVSFHILWAILSTSTVQSIKIFRSLIFEQVSQSYGHTPICTCTSWDRRHIRRLICWPQQCSAPNIWPCSRAPHGSAWLFPLNINASWEYLPLFTQNFAHVTSSTHRKILFQILSWIISSFEPNEPHVRSVIQRSELRCHIDDETNAIFLESGSRY